MINDHVVLIYGPIADLLSIGQKMDFAEVMTTKAP